MADIYFDLTSGDDTTGNGSLATPYKTLNKAHTEASDGDTLILKDGTHTLVANVTTNITKTNITITSESQDAKLCIIDGDSLYYYNNTVGNNITLNINHITFQNMVLGANKLFLSNTGNINVGTFNFSYIICKNISLTESLILRNFGSSSSLLVTINNCLFEEISTGRVLIIENAITNFVYINNNTFVNVSRATDNYFRVRGGSLIFKNNIFYCNHATNVNITTQSVSKTAIEFYNNCYVNLGLGTISLGVAIVDVDQNNIATDPLFVDTPNSDFRLRPSSPCIDTGTVL